MGDDTSHGASLERKILTGYAVQAARDYAKWLEDEGELEAALVVLEAALREGPDFGRGELSSVSLLDDLEARWNRINTRLGRHAPFGGEIYNEGLRDPVEPDWREVLARARAARRRPDDEA
jgi:hypothetical protein